MKILKVALLCGATLGLYSGAASAADLYTPEPVAANPFDGFYAGVHGGYGSSDGSGDWWAIYSVLGQRVAEDGPIKYDLDDDGYMAGGQAGWNYVTEAGWLFGAEVSMSWADIDGQYIETEAQATTTVWSTIDAIGLAQGKLGYASDRFALYAQGGLALAHTEVTNYWGGKMDTTSTGWTVGAGGDFMVTDKVSLGVSYNYIELDEERMSADYTALGFDVDLNATYKAKLHIVKINAAYQF